MELDLLHRAAQPRELDAGERKTGAIPRMNDCLVTCGFRTWPNMKVKDYFHKCRAGLAIARRANAY